VDSPGSVTVSQLAGRYNVLLAEAIDLNVLVRDADLQQRKVDDLEAFRLLVRHAKGRPARGRVAPSHRCAGIPRDWVRKWVKRICNTAGVPKVTAHGMRGLHSTLAVEHGVSAHVVARVARTRIERDDDPELRETQGGRGGSAAPRDDRPARWPTRRLSLKRLGRESFQTAFLEEKLRQFRGAERDLDR
jgi:hypothetical protein